MGFKHAFRGIWKMLQTERNFKVQLILGILAISLGFYFSIEKWEWIAIVICCGIVLGSEMLNSAIERICDGITSEIDPNIKWIKDASAGAVLILSLCSFIIGSLIFYPYFEKLF